MRVIHMYEMQLNLAMDCIGVGLRWPFLLWLSHFKTKTSFGFLVGKLNFCVSAQDVQSSCINVIVFIYSTNAMT